MKARVNSIFFIIGWEIKRSLPALFFFFSSAGLFAQVLDSTELQKQKVFVSLDEAMVNPSVVYRLDLSKQHLQFIPENVFKLTNLQELDLSRNKIQSVPVEIGNLKRLQILNLSGNKLKTLPAGIGRLENLKYLFLKRNRIEVLPAETGKLRSLIYLDLWGNKIIQLPVQMAGLAHSLRTIDMRGSAIKPEYINAIKDMLPETMVYFSGCNCN